MSVHVELIKIDFDKLIILNLPKEFIRKIKIDYYQYLFELNKIEIIFNETKINLSSHTNEKINIIKKEYKKKYKKDLKVEISALSNFLYDDVLELLNYIKKGDYYVQKDNYNVITS